MKRIVNSFNAGELSRQLDGRTDLAKYGSGCRVLENFIPRPYGSISRRSGFEFISEVKDSSKAVRLVPFQFNTEQAYILEFGNEYMRVYKDGAQVQSLGSAYEVETPWLEADLPSLRYIQSADVLFVAHENYAPRKISRVDHDDWSVDVVDFIGGPFLAENAGDIAITPNYPEWVTATDYLAGDCVSAKDAAKVIDASAAVDRGLGYVGIPLTAHGYTKNDVIEIAGTTNYNGLWTVQNNTTANQIVIRAPYVAETFGAGDTAQRNRYYECIVAHTSGAGHLTPPGNAVDWQVAKRFGGSNMILTASDDLFDEGHVGSLWQLSHVRNDNSADGSFAAVTESDSISVSGLWDFVTHGTWTGSMEILRSFDGGQTFESYRLYASVNDRNVAVSGEENESGVLYKIAMTDYTSGTCRWEFTVQDYRYNGVVKITAVNSATEATATVQSVVGKIERTVDWSEGAWSDYRGWPRCLAFFEERLIFGGSPSRPQTIWGSQTNDWENFGAGTLDNEAVIFTIAHDQVNAIRWLQAHQHLMIGTSGGEWRMSGSGENEPLTPTNVTNRIQSNYGSAADLPSEIVNNAVLFFSRNTRKLRELVYNFERDGYVSPDMTILAEHATESGIVSIDYQQQPDNILWAVRGDGQLVGMTYERDQDVIGWHRHVTDGAFECVAVIPGQDEDEVWVVVNRTIGGAIKRYIERKKPQAFASASECFFVDSGLSYDGGSLKAITAATNSSTLVVSSAGHGFSNGDKVLISGVVGMTELNGKVWEIHAKTADAFSLKDETGTDVINSSTWGVYVSGGEALPVSKSFSGLEHLEGETVQILADGAVQPSKVVASGSVELDRYANIVHAGLAYVSTVQPMRLDFSASGGSGQGATKRINRVRLRFFQSIHAKVGPTMQKLDTVYFRSPDMPMDSGVALFDGDKEVSFNGTYDADGDILVVQDLPLPLSLLALIFDARAYE